MAQNKTMRLGPVALTTTLTSNILNPPTTTGGFGASSPTANCYMIIRHIRIVNKTGTAATFSFWIGTTGTNAAGSEFMGIGSSVPANSSVDWYGQLRLDPADFLVGGAGTATALSFQAEAEVGLA